MPIVTEASKETSGQEDIQVIDADIISTRIPSTEQTLKVLELRSDKGPAHIDVAGHISLNQASKKKWKRMAREVQIVSEYSQLELGIAK